MKRKVRESGKVQLGLLVAVVLAAGAAGVWSELQAAGANTSRIVGGGVFVGGNSSFAQIAENGDGTAFTLGTTWLENGTILAGGNFANPAYSVSVDLKPGQSGKSTASGTASATFDGAYLDGATWETIAPAVIKLDLAMAGTTDVSAYVQQGVQATVDPYTGDYMVSRVNRIGNDGIGATAGAISFTVDGAVVSEETGVFGNASIYSVNTVVRIK